MPDDIAKRVHLVALPMTDVEENAAIVNVLQRRADVVVQTSLAEGFGLMVAEAMRKAHPSWPVASGASRTRSCTARRESCSTIHSTSPPTAPTVRWLLEDPARAAAMARQAKESMRHRFLGTRTLMQAIELCERRPHAGAALKVLEAARALNVALPLC